MFRPFDLGYLRLAAWGEQRAEPRSFHTAPRVGLLRSDSRPMRAAPCVVVQRSYSDVLSGVVEAEEQALAEQFVAHPP